MKKANESCRTKFVNALNCESEEKSAFLLDLSLGLDVINAQSDMVFGNGHYDGKTSAKAIIALHDVLGHDAAPGSYRTFDYSIFGGSIEIEKYGLPVLIKLPFSDASALYEVDSASVCGKCEDAKESYRIVGESDRNMGVMQLMMTPFSASAMMRGIEQWMMDLVLEQSYVMDMLLFQSELYSTLSEELIDVPSDAIVIAAPFDNPDIVSHLSLSGLSYPGIKAALNIAKDMGKPSILHPHGIFSQNHGEMVLNDMIAMKPSCLYYGEGNTPKSILKHTRGECSVAGGIDTFTTIYLGPDDRVQKDVEKIMNEAGNNDFLFTCSCSLDRGLPIHRLKMMMSTFRSF